MVRLGAVFLGGVYLVDSSYKGFCSYDDQFTKYAFIPEGDDQGNYTYALDVERRDTEIPEVFGTYFECTEVEEFFKLWTAIEVVAKLESRCSFLVFKSVVSGTGLDLICPSKLEIARVDTSNLWIAVGKKLI